MYVNELHKGMLLEPAEGFICYLQESRKAKIPRLRIAPHVIASLGGFLACDTPIMYLGKSSFKNRSRKVDNLLSQNCNLRTVMIDGQIAFVEGREFKNINPVL